MSSRDQRRMRKFYLSFLSNLRKWLARVGSPFRISRKFIRNLMRQGATSAQAGFILPTVVFVTVATTLLVLAVVARSADRAQSAANARVEQVFEVAAAPIIDRARSKIEALLNDDNLPRSTPPEGVLEAVISGTAYTYGDETRLQIIHDYGSRSGNSTVGLPDNTIEVSDPDIADREFINTAWKFPIDTDNNGLFDSYGLYSILFRTRPPALSDGNPTPPDRPIIPLEARTLPFEETNLSSLCARSSGVRVVTNEGWTQSGNRLKKAFYVYTATVPITDPSSFPTANTSNFDNPANFEVYRGIPSISALELQQDRARNPVNNNAAWFEGDLELARPARFRFNGRIYVGGSLLIGALNNTNPIQIYQVSSSGTDPANENTLGSCYYERANAEINVAGNVVEGDALTNNTNLLDATIDLFKGQGVEPDDADLTPTAQPTIGDANQTVNETGDLAALNEFEFNRRVNLLVDAAIARSALSNVTRTGGTINLVYSPAADADPPPVQTDLKGRVRDEGIFGPGILADTARRKALEVYFRARLAKVTYKEVPFGSVPPANPSDFPFTLVPIPVSAGGGNDLAPPFSWAIPAYTNGGNVVTAAANYPNYDGKGLRQATSGLTLKDVTNPVTALPTIGPETLEERQNVEQFLGDRMRVGNNLPVRWLLNDGSTTAFVGESTENRYTTDDSILFNDPNNINAGATGKPRYRNTRAASLDNLGETGRGGFWELSAADDPSNGDAPPDPSPITGGLRVITNAGIFSARPQDTFLPRFYTGFNDDTLTATIDESAAPLWDGRPQDNPITVDGDNLAQPLNEATFAAPDPTSGDGFNEENYVVWPDSMPMSGAIVYLSSTPKRFLLPDNTPIDISVPAAEAGYYPQAPGGLPTIDGTDPTPTSGTRVDLATPAQRTAARALANRKGNLQMRASAVYHYKASVFNPETATPQRPIACVSSYFDNSTPLTARNGLVNDGGTFVNSPWNFNPEGRSNNGLVYSAATLPAGGLTGVPPFDTATQKFVIPDTLAAANPYNTAVTIANRLAYQANLVYPNGRFVNETLRNTLRRIAGGATTLSISEQSTLDANICALQILDGTASLITATDDIASFTVNGATINLPQGTIKESAFLDARELKSLNRNESLTESGYGMTGGLIPINPNRADIYDLEIEQRQPLEVRVTDLDIDRMRGATVTGGINTGVPTEFILPYSGLIYASREDALEDLSYYDNVTTPDRRFEFGGGAPVATALSKRRALSSTDFLVDPTRKVSGVRLINGYRLWRSTAGQTNLDDPTSNNLGNLTVSGTTQPNFTEATLGEKGLILVSNLPAYIRAQRGQSPATKNCIANTSQAPVAPVGFNVHTQEEFTNCLNEVNAEPKDIWNNFYKRNRNSDNTDRLNPNFACRPGQTNDCTVGDQWRPATVLADAVTILSGQWRDGYRDDGDFDLRNNANTSTSINWQTTLNSNAEKRKDSFYVVSRRKQGFFNNNFVTNANYLATTNSDGGTGSTSDDFPRGNRNSFNANGVTPVQRRASTREYNMEVCRRLPLEECGFDRWEKVGGGTTTMYASTTLPTDTAANRPEFVYPQDRRYPRRVSFLRYDDIYGDGNKALVFASTCPNPGTGSNSAFPIPINVDLGGDDARGITVPQILGDLSTPFGTKRRRLYGDVACPPTQETTIEITGNQSQFEGRLRGNNTGLPINLPAISPSNYNSISVNAPGADSTIPYSRFLFDVRVNNLGSAPGTVSADIAVPNTGTATRGLPGSPQATIPNSNTSDNTRVDVIQRVYANANCRDASNTPIPSGTAITKVFFPAGAPKICQVAVLVSRDIMDEPQEDFRLQISNSVNATIVPGSNIRVGTIRQTTGGDGTLITNTVNVQAPDIVVVDRIGCPRPTPNDIVISNNIISDVTGPVVNPAQDDGIGNPTRTRTITRQRVISRSQSNCPPTPTPGGGTGTGTMLPPPVFGSLPHPFTIGGSHGLMTVGAAYPFPTGDYTGDRANRTCNNEQVRGYSCNANPPVILTKNPAEGIGNSLFGTDKIAPLPNDPNALIGATTNGIGGGGIAPLVPGATQDRNTSTDPRNRTLWFRYTSSDSDPIGTESRLRYNRDSNIMVYTHAWPSISGSDNNRGNLNHGSRLVLPDTVCITTDGFVDARCLTQTPETQNTTTAPANLANLNLPYNPHFPSDQNSNTGTSSVVPVSSYLVCGVSGNNRSIQADANAFTSSSCGGTQRGVINTFRSRLSAAVGNGFNITSTGTGTLNDPFVFTALNTFNNNKINVINLNVFDANSSGGDDGIISGDVILRANRNGNGTNLGPSPVFVLYTPNPVDLTFKGLRIKLDGVEPNNIFWLIDKTGAKALTIVGNQAEPSIIPGNFIGVMPASGGNFADSSGLNIGRTAAADGTGSDNGSENGAFNSTDDNNAIYVTFRGARFLGFRALTPSAADGDASSPTDIGINPSIVAAAMTSVDQPILLPVLQIHAPQDTSTTNDKTMPEPNKASGDNGTSGSVNLAPVNRPTESVNGRNTSTGGGQWTMRATPVQGNGNDATPFDRVEVNVYSVAGNTPSRSGVTFRSNYRAPFVANSGGVNLTTAETGGGLHNFVRLLESWTDVPLKIAGGFLQNTRSRYAVGPFSQTFPYTDLSPSSPSRLDFSSDIQTLWINPLNSNTANYPLSRFRKYGNSAAGQNIPFYSPPLRLFGFDVGILTQTADLFASRFSTAIPNPDEFYRETNAEDFYVRQLLCALEPGTLDGTTRLGTTPSQYTASALKGKDLPPDCAQVVRDQRSPGALTGFPSSINYN